MHPAVFLDRDNTLIQNDGDLGDPKRVRLVHGAAPAVASLCGLGFKIVVFTNQGGVARGKFKEKDVEAVHRRIAQLVEAGANGARIDGFYFCPHHPQGKVAKYKQEHPSRKPAPGMLLQAAEEMNLDLKRSWTIGDQLRDVQAGAAAGTRTILLRDDADQLAPLDTADLIAAHDEAAAGADEAPNYYASSLIEAVRIIAQQRKPDVEQPTARAMAGERKWDAAAVAQLQRETAPIASRPPVAAPPPAKPFRPWNAPQPTPEGGPSQGEPAPTPPVVRTAGEPAPQPGASTKLLRQILQELRQQRGGGEQQFSHLTVTAIVLQAVAVLCLLGALWMGAGDDALFMRWALAGLITQGATIALLLFARHA